MKYFELFDYAHDLANDIIRSDNFKKLQMLSKKINTELKDKIDLFNKYKEEYDEALKYGKYYPNLKELQNNLSKAKEMLFTDSLVIEYKKLEKEIQNELNLIADKLKDVVKENRNDSKKMCNCIL